VESAKKTAGPGARGCAWPAKPFTMSDGRVRQTAISVVI